LFHLSSSSTRLVRAGALALAGATATAAVLIAATSSSAATAVGARTPSCQSRGLVIWLDTNGNGTAGAIVYDLNFTNQSGHRCTLRGYPGVSAINLRGGRLGSPATRNSANRVRTITLRNGHTATSQVKIDEAGNFSPSFCGPVNAAGLRVFAPNQSSSKTVPFPFPACSRTGIMQVKAVT
jgi:Protein of unknown function (DUF4232)